MKRILKMLSCILCLIIITVVACGCRKKVEQPAESAVTSVYATFYPLYAATEMLIEGVADVRLNCLVQPQDGCMRDYQLSDWDLALLHTADLIIAGGRGLEDFESILYGLGENGPVVSAVLYNMELTEQKAVNTSEDTQSHWLDPNPHIYMQIDSMKEIVQRAANTLILLDAENEGIYKRNLEAAQARLDELRNEIEESLAEIRDQKVIIMNEALVYAAQEYGLKPCLFYERESGSELYDSDLDVCLRTLQKCDAKVILIEKQAPQTFCEALEAAGYRLAHMDVLSTHSASEGSEGYFEAHRENIQAIKAAFDYREN